MFPLNCFVEMAIIEPKNNRLCYIAGNFFPAARALIGYLEVP